MRIKPYFESLKPGQIGLKDKIRVSLVEKLGMGANNANFLVVANGKKFVFRLNMLLSEKRKSSSEFNHLKLVEKLGIAPKSWILDESRKIFDSDFIILDYLEGKELGKLQYSLNREIIKKIVGLCIKFHSMPIKGVLLKLPKYEVNYEYLLDNTYKKYLSLTKMASDKKFIEMIKENYDNLRSKCGVNKQKHPLVFAHGDIQEHNIIVHKGKFRLIDYEGVELTDPASEIAYIFTQFSSRKEFNEKQREIFLNEYLKHRKDPTLRERVKVFMPMKNFLDLLWAVGQALKIKHRLMHSSYLTKDALRDAVEYAQMVFGRCIRDGTIDKKYKDFDLGRVII